MNTALGRRPRGAWPAKVQGAHDKAKQHGFFLGLDGSYGWLEEHEAQGRFVKEHMLSRSSTLRTLFKDESLKKPKPMRKGATLRDVGKAPSSMF